ncbi:MAG: hypothetical protein KUL75_09520 [Sterolibacterium sp.]|nr:hypothetical protein [Sterolibacterium sp.]
MDSLVAVAIHDAKNSLNSLGVLLARARQDFSRREQVHSVQPADCPALKQAEALVGLLTGQLVELLAFYRAGEGSLRMSIEDHLLPDFLAEVMAEFAVSRSAEDVIRVETDFSVAEEIGPWVFDAYLVKFALLDALRNAVRHAHRKVRFSIGHLMAEGMRFTVEDDGPGYPEEILGDFGSTCNGWIGEAGSGTGGRTGLGLSFARLIASRHAVPSGQSRRAGQQGRLELANDGFAAEGGQGARLTLILP